MGTRIISFLAGAAFGAVCAMVVVHVGGDLRDNWGIVWLAATGMGLLSALFGKKFWELVLTLWP